VAARPTASPRAGTTNRAARARWREYLDWCAHRNLDRSDLETKFGYDTKHAMHLVRLQRMAVEVLETGVLVVTRPDRDELLAIRDGAWTFADLEAADAELGHRIDRASSASVLPDEPDDDALDALCADIVGEVLGCCPQMSNSAASSWRTIHRRAACSCAP